MTDDDVACPRRKVHAQARLHGEQVAWVLETNATIRRSVDEMKQRIEYLAHRDTVLLAGKPKITITIDYEHSGFAFPDEALDLYLSERVGQALGMDVKDDVDTLVIRRSLTPGS